MKSREVVERLRNARLLTVQDSEVIRGDHMGIYQRPGDYAYRDYPQKLEEYLGIDIQVVNSGELEYRYVNDKKAEEMASLWINDAQEMRNGVKKEDVIRAAKLYFSLSRLIREYEADAVTMASFGLAGAWGEPKTNAMPPLSWMELSKENIPCCCQGLVDCLVTQLIGTYVTDGWAGFTGDILNDWRDWNSFLKNGSPGNVLIIGHCGAPITPHGNDRIPYAITDHVINSSSWAKLFGPDETATAITVEWPVDETVTVLKFDVYKQRVLIFAGTALDGCSLYRGFRDVTCRNKMVIRIDDPEIYTIFSGDLTGFREEWGNHIVVFYGDLRKRIAQIADMIGFEVTCC